MRVLVRAHTIPAQVQDELHIDTQKPIIYLLHTRSVADLLALAFSARKVGLPNPLTSQLLPGTDIKHPRALFLHTTMPVFGKKPRKTDIESQFTELFNIHRQHPDMDIQFVPAYVTWGRAPEKSKPNFSDLVVDVASPSWLRKFFIVLFLGRDNFLSYSRAVSSKFMSDQHGSDGLIAKNFCAFCHPFSAQTSRINRANTLERQTLHSAVVGAQAVKLAMREEVRSKNITPAKAKQMAHDYLDEIAGDYREGLVRFANRILTPIWNKIYNGISVNNAATVRELSRNGHEIVYVPCHRSHMDYLLLTYVIYHEGLVTPHILCRYKLELLARRSYFPKSRRILFASQFLLATNCTPQSLENT